VLLTRRQGLTIGVVAALGPAALAIFAFAGSFGWFGMAIVFACLGSGAVIGSTIGRGLAQDAGPRGVMAVSAIAVVIGDLIATPMLAWDGIAFDPVGAFVGGLVYFGFPAYFFLAIPGVVVGVKLARGLKPGRA
jgi:hypothetical protein